MLSTTANTTKKTEEEYRVLSQKYHRLISDYDLLKKTSEDVGGVAPRRRFLH